MQAELARRGDDPEGLGVAGREDRGRWVRAREHTPSEVTRLVAAVATSPVPPFREAESRQGKLFAEPALAVAARGEPEGIGDGVADEGDRAMPEIKEMSGSERTSPDVVTGDAR